MKGSVVRVFAFDYYMIVNNKDIHGLFDPTRVNLTIGDRLWQPEIAE